MSTFLAQDSDNNPIPVLRLKDGAAHAIAAGAVSARNTIAFDSETRVVSLYATVPVYVRFGSAAVTATASDHYFPAGVYYDLAIGGGKTAHLTHVAVLSAEGTGTLYVSEKA